MNTVLPEIILLETLKAGIEFVRKDYNNKKPAVEKSYLYHLLNGAALQKYNLFEQAKQVICGADDSPRMFDIDLAFNKKIDSVPSAHITLPSEMTGQGNGIGTDEGYADYIEEMAGEFNNDHNEDFNVAGVKTLRAVLCRRKTAKYNIVIVSDNTNEVVLLYHFLTAILIALIPHLHIKGLQNIAFGGQDLQPYTGMAPELHMRAISLDLQYDTFVPSIFPTELIENVVADGKPLKV